MTPRRGVLGLETEYAVVSTPEVGSSVPDQSRVFEALARALRRDHPCADAAYRKGGLFLANGGLVHLEADADDPEHGFIEIATPECTSVREVVAHHRGLERLVAGLIPEAAASLEDAPETAGSRPGPATGDRPEAAPRLVLGKASADYHGRTFGTHENYLVRDDPGPVRRVALAAALVAYHLVRLPLTISLVVVGGVTILLYGIFLCWVAVRPLLGHRFEEEQVPSDPLPRLIERCLRVNSAIRRGEQLLMLPAFSRLVARLVLPAFRRHLVGFLVTRPVFTGPGHLATDRPDEGARFVLSPKAQAIGAVMESFSDPARKPLIDIKGLFSGITRLFDREKRLHVTFSDTNMSEYALWLKLGTTDLTVRAIEAGYVPCGCELVDPIGALKTVSADLTFRERLACRGGEQRTELEIQASYLETAGLYVTERCPDDPEARQVLEAWHEVLGSLELDPGSLADRLDWVAKRDLMDEAVEGTGWDPVMRVLQPVRYLEEKNVGLGRAIDEPAGVREFLRRRLGVEFVGLACRMDHCGIAWESLPALYRLFYQLKKIDLKYHEVGDGYHARMEREGLFVRVLADDRIDAAALAPPATRAALRCRYAREAIQSATDVLVGWDLVIVPCRYKVIALSDPLGTDARPTIAELRAESFWWCLLRLVPFLPRLVTPF